jgi:hypothetical protein
MVTHPLPFTLPVDTMKVRSNYQDEQERRVFLSTPSQHETARMDRPIFESLTEALQLRWGTKSASAREFRGYCHAVVRVTEMA